MKITSRQTAAEAKLENFETNLDVYFNTHCHLEPTHQVRELLQAFCYGAGAKQVIVDISVENCSLFVTVQVSFTDLQTDDFAEWHSFSLFNLTDSVDRYLKDVAQLKALPSPTTVFLRGDNTWVAVDPVAYKYEPFQEYGGILPTGVIAQEIL